jgi:hypothetical protein
MGQESRRGDRCTVAEQADVRIVPGDGQALRYEILLRINQRIRTFVDRAGDDLAAHAPIPFLAQAAAVPAPFKQLPEKGKTRHEPAIKKTANRFQ